MLCASVFSPLLMDRSASIRVAPEPLPVRRHRDPRHTTRGTVATFSRRTLSVSRDPFKLERSRLTRLGEMLQSRATQGMLGETRAHTRCIPSAGAEYRLAAEH